MKFSPPTTPEGRRSLADLLTHWAWRYRKNREPEAAAHCERRAAELRLAADAPAGTETLLEASIAFATFAFVLAELYMGWGITP